MGVDLRGHYEGLHLNWGAWGYCLRVARAFGWQPEGTQRPYIEVRNPDGTPDLETTALYNSGTWGGGYFSNDYQNVADSDAKALAAALERAIEALVTGARLTDGQCRAFAEGDEHPPDMAAAYDPAVDIVDRRQQQPPAFDTGPLKRLADFARHGGFAIG